MGYYASGWVTVTASEAQITAAALRLEDELSEFYDGYVAESIRERLTELRDLDFLPRLLTATRFEEVFSSTNDKGEISCEGRYDDKWWEGAEFAHRLLAKAGAKVQGRFRGEDDEAWTWASSDGLVQDESLVELPHSQVDHLLAAAKFLQEIQQFLAEPIEADKALAEVRRRLAAWSAG